MKFIFIILIFIAAGCARNDKNSTKENILPTMNIDGEKLFKNNCASCHKTDKDFTGPSLKGALERWGDKKAMYDFIRNPSKSISENAYAKEVFNKWNKTMMTAFILSDAELDAIMNYVSKPGTASK
jgi:cytochrome c2